MTKAKPKLALVGIGKIAIDQHLPSIAATDLFDLVAVVSQRGIAVPGITTFRSQRELFAELPGVANIANCTPPHVRHSLAIEALEAGKNLLIEKPPTASIAELAHMVSVAANQNRTLFATWHSRFNSAVEQAKHLLKSRPIDSVVVVWKEDVRRWHPGQNWVFEAGGFGVFDPGINALSIVTAILPYPVFVEKAELFFPANRATPIAVDLRLRGPAHASLKAIQCAFDWRQEGEQTWSIAVRFQDSGTLELTHGGTRLFLDGDAKVSEPDSEYRSIYRRFYDLVGTSKSDVDASPLQLVADAFMIGTRHEVESFLW
jgi:D-galactose 1-dehydrogenase